MPPNDRDPAMGIILAALVSIGGVAVVAAVTAWGGPVLRYAAWVVAVLAEVVR